MSPAHCLSVAMRSQDILSSAVISVQPAFPHAIRVLPCVAAGERHLCCSDSRISILNLFFFFFRHWFGFLHPFNCANRRCHRARLFLRVSRGASEHGSVGPPLSSANRVLTLTNVPSDEFVSHGMSSIVTLTHRNVCKNGFTVTDTADSGTPS